MTWAGLRGRVPDMYHQLDRADFDVVNMTPAANRKRGFRQVAFTNSPLWPFPRAKPLYSQQFRPHLCTYVITHIKGMQYFSTRFAKIFEKSIEVFMATKMWWMPDFYRRNRPGNLV